MKYLRDLNNQLCFQLIDNGIRPFSIPANSIYANKATNLTIAMVLLLLAVSCTSSGTVRDMELYLNSKVGTVHDKRDWKYFRLIEQTPTYSELEQKRDDGCSFVIRVNNDTGKIESWRFTSDKSLCKFTYAPSV